MATDPLKKSLNRALQIKTDAKYNKGIKLYDIDLAISDYMVDVVVPAVEVLDEWIKPPVIYGNAERWKNITKDGFLRDDRGQIQIPLIVYKRNSIDRDDSMPNMMNRHLTYPANSQYSKKHKYDKFSLMTGVTRPVEQYNITVPDYVTLTYEVMIWTDFTEHMNKIVEAFQYATDEYWGDKSGFKFRVKIDSFDNTSEVGDGAKRIIRTNFTMMVNAYLLPEKFNNEPTTKKSLTIKKLIWNDDVVTTGILKLTEQEKEELAAAGRTGVDYVTKYYNLLDDYLYDGGAADTW